MLTIFNTMSLYIGTDMKRFNEIRDILDANKIKYKYNTKNHLGEWTGRGTVRGNTGSFRNVSELMYEYDIKVLKSDYEEAKYFIS
ncbi:MAG: hypothetical protein Q4G60_11680 [bacterium]|nr:hypothetical protein [bacterium]